MVQHLMDLLENGGFFRENGFKNLPSVKHIAGLLKIADVFTNARVKIENIGTFLNNSKDLRIS